MFLLLLSLVAFPVLAVAEVDFADSRPLLTRPGIDDLGVHYGHLLTCMRDKQFPADLGPREVQVSKKGDRAESAKVTITSARTGLPVNLSINVATFESHVVVESISIGHRYGDSQRDRHGIVLLFLDGCPAVNPVK